MARFDPLGNRCDFSVSVHVRQVANSQSSVLHQIRSAQRVYGKIGIHFNVVTMRSTSLDPAVFARLAITDTECRRNVDSAEQAEIFSRLGATGFQEGIWAVFVHDIRTSKALINGCAASSTVRAAVLIAALGSPWTLAHEVGHVLLGTFNPSHSMSRKNLMFGGTDDLHPTEPPGFDLAQQAQIFRSPHVVRC